MNEIAYGTTVFCGKYLSKTRVALGEMTSLQIKAMNVDLNKIDGIVGNISPTGRTHIYIVRFIADNEVARLKAKLFIDELRLSYQVDKLYKEMAHKRNKINKWIEEEQDLDNLLRIDAMTF
jgi:hypothetical protein